MITREEYLTYCDAAFEGLYAVAVSLGDDLVSTRLPVPGGNSVFGLATHCAGVAGRWARQVNRGIPVPRDRDAEFTATGTVAELRVLLAAARDRLHEDAAETVPGARPAAPPPDQPDCGTQGEVLLHVYEELAQHLGQAEVIRDVLLARPPITSR